MKNWEAASSKIRRRTSDVWRGIDLALPVEIDIASEDVFISSALYEIEEPETELVLQFPERDRLWAAEIIISAQKYSHVARLTKKRAEEGAMTWAATDAHHAVLLGIKCFLSTLGIGICEGKNRAHLVDFRPECGNIDEARRFVKSYKSITSPVRVLTPSKQLFEQKDIFKLLERSLNIIDIPKNSENIIETIKTMNLGTHKAERNKLLYHGEYWHWHNDLTWPSIDIGVHQEIEKGLDGVLKDFFILKEVNKMVLINLKPCADYLNLWGQYLEPMRINMGEGHDPLSFLPSN